MSSAHNMPNSYGNSYHSDTQKWAIPNQPATAPRTDSSSLGNWLFTLPVTHPSLVAGICLLIMVAKSGLAKGAEMVLLISLIVAAGIALIPLLSTGHRGAASIAVAGALTYAIGTGIAILDGFSFANPGKVAILVIGAVGHSVLFFAAAAALNKSPLAPAWIAVVLFLGGATRMCSAILFFLMHNAFLKEAMSEAETLDELSNLVVSPLNVATGFVFALWLIVFGVHGSNSGQAQRSATAF